MTVMKPIFISLFFLCSFSAFSQDKDSLVIVHTLNSQTQAWNQGDLEAFMKGYWKNDSLSFIGKSGVTYGWQNTLNNYRKGYPDTATMGKLKFDILSVNRLSPEYFYVIGKWQLTRTIGNVSGHYTLLFRKMNGEWVIVADHSS